MKEQYQMKKLLFLNACVNMETSRTYRLGSAFISLLQQSGNFETTELVLEKEYAPALTSETLNKRLALLDKKDFADPMFRYAHQFSEAEYIVIAAPYWDFGFPAILKTYIEAVNVPGIAYRYGAGGRPEGMCKAEKIYYITTRGGFVTDEKDLGFSTIVDMGLYYGLTDVKCISLNALDIPTTDVEAVITKAIEDLPTRM
jgi:FMN-dependent NADH-azoreductase